MEEVTHEITSQAVFFFSSFEDVVGNSASNVEMEMNIELEGK
jgi:hypothetical protein